MREFFESDQNVHREEISIVQMKTPFSTFLVEIEKNSPKLTLLKRFQMPKFEFYDRNKTKDFKISMFVHDGQI